MAEVQMEPDNTGLSVEVAYGKTASQKVIEFSAARQQAKDFLSIIKKGDAPTEVAQEALVQWTSPEVKAAVKDLIETWELPAEQRKRLVRARMNRELVTGDSKDAINAAKIIGADPEIGLNQPAANNIQQNFSVEFMKLLGPDAGEIIEVKPNEE